MKLCAIFFWLLVHANLISPVAGQTGNVIANAICPNSTGNLFLESALETLLFQDYWPYARPRLVPSEDVWVTFSITIQSIRRVLEIEQHIVLSGYIEVKWVDEFLRWSNRSEFNCINMIVVPAKRIWKPDMVQIGNENKYSIFRMAGEKARVYKDGRVEMRPGGLISANCQFDLTDFPYDEQTCEFAFQSWLLVNNFFRIKLDQMPVYIWNFEENQEWEFVNASAWVHDVYYSNKNHAYDGVSISLKIRRKVGFYVMNVILPAIIISLAELATFALPPHEPIKIHISFSILLAYTVFQIMIVPETPKTSEKTPALSIFIVLEMAYIGIALLGQGLVFVLLERADSSKTPHRWTFYIFHNFIGPFLGMELSEGTNPTESEMDTKLMEMTTKISPNEYPTLYSSLFNDHPDYNDHNEEAGLFGGENGADKIDKIFGQSKRCTVRYIQSTESKGSGRRKLTDAGRLNDARWNYVVRTIDRLFLVIYVILIFSTPIFMFFIHQGEHG